MKRIIATDHAPAAIGPYSQAVESGNLLFVSGQLGLDPATGDFVPGGVREQAEQAFRNLKAILSEAGYTLEHVLKATVFLTDMNDFSVVNEVYASHFSGLPCPARSAIAVCKLPKGGLVEIEVIASR